MNNRGKQVWLVDDDDDDLLLLAVAFERVAPTVTITRLQDGEDLLPLLGQSPPPNLIILDLNMIRSTGFQTLKSLRDTLIFSHLPVVVLTTSESPEDKKRSLTLGANDFYTKPSRFDELTRLAAKLVQDWLPEAVG